MTTNPYNVNIMKTNKEYRQTAKECVKAYSGKLLGVRALVSAATTGIDAASRGIGRALGGIIGKKQVGGDVGSSIQHTIMDGSIKIGLARVYTKVAKKEKFTISKDLFSGIKERFAFGAKINFLLPFYSFLYFILGAAVGFGAGYGVSLLIENI
jgi:hypothetical protein